MEVKLKDKKSIEVSHVTGSGEIYEVDLKVVLPKSIEIKGRLTKEDIVEDSIDIERHLHKGKSISLMLLYIKLAQKHQSSMNQFKESLNLFSHLFIKDITTYEIKNDSTEEVLSTIQDYINIIEVFRQLSLDDEDKYITFRKIDPLISFELEQFLLKISLKDKDVSIRDLITCTIEAEKEYRIKQCYEHKHQLSHADIQDDDRLSRVVNQNDMQRKLIKLPLKVNEEIERAGKKEKYLSIALSTGIIMLVFCFIIFQLRLMGLDTNVQFVAAFAGMYMVRDVFKENIKDRIYNRLMKNKPVAKSWLSVPNGDELAKITTRVRIDDTNSVKVGKEASEISISEQGRVRNFEHNGFKKIKHTVTLDLTKVIKLFPYGRRELYIQNANANVQKVSVQRRGRLDFVVAKTTRSKNQSVTEIEEYRVTFDRSKIIKIEKR